MEDRRSVSKPPKTIRGLNPQSLATVQRCPLRRNALESRIDIVENRAGHTNGSTVIWHPTDKKSFHRRQRAFVARTDAGDNKAYIRFIITGIRPRNKGALSPMKAFFIRWMPYHSGTVCMARAVFNNINA